MYLPEERHSHLPCRAFVYFCYSSTLSFLTPYAKQIHLIGAASFFFVAYSIAIVISRPFTGRLFDSKGENITMYPAFIILSIGMLLLSQVHHALPLLLAGAFIGFGVGVVQSCGLAIAVKLTPQKRLGLANSTFYIFIDLGLGIGPVILGMFIPFSGYRVMDLGLAFISFLCAFLNHLLHGRRAKEVSIVQI